jgi:hypothetical protein
MTVATQTLEGQLDALIAEHGLTAISLARIRLGDGSMFWSVNTQDDILCGRLNGSGKVPVEVALTAALEDLNALRARPVVVPELAALEQAV